MGNYNPRNTFDKYQQSGNLDNELEWVPSQRFQTRTPIYNEIAEIDIFRILLCLGNLTFGCAVFGGIFSSELEP